MITLFQVIQIRDILKPKSILVRDLKLEINDFLSIRLECENTTKPGSNTTYARYITITNLRNTYEKKMSLNTFVNILDNTISYVAEYKI